MITAYRDKPTLMTRTAGDRLGVLYAQARPGVLAPEESKDVHRLRNIVDLPLTRSGIPVFALSWTPMHVIDETSPLRGMDRPAMAGPACARS